VTPPTTTQAKPPQKSGSGEKSFPKQLRDFQSSFVLTPPPRQISRNITTVPPPPPKLADTLASPSHPQQSGNLNVTQTPKSSGSETEHSKKNGEESWEDQGEEDKEEFGLDSSLVSREKSEGSLRGGTKVEGDEHLETFRVLTSGDMKKVRTSLVVVVFFFFESSSSFWWTVERRSARGIVERSAGTHDKAHCLRHKPAVTGGK